MARYSPLRSGNAPRVGAVFVCRQAVVVHCWSTTYGSASNSSGVSIRMLRISPAITAHAVWAESVNGWLPALRVTGGRWAARDLPSAAADHRCTPAKGVARINQMRVFNLLVGLPDGRPLPWMFQEPAGNIPQGVPLNYNVFIRMVGAYGYILCQCCSGQQCRKDEANEFPFHFPFPNCQASRHMTCAAVFNVAMLRCHWLS